MGLDPKTTPWPPSAWSDVRHAGEVIRIRRLLGSSRLFLLSQRLTAHEQEIIVARRAETPTQTKPFPKVARAVPFIPTEPLLLLSIHRMAGIGGTADRDLRSQKVGADSRRWPRTDLDCAWHVQRNWSPRLVALQPGPIKEPARALSHGRDPERTAFDRQQGCL